MAKPDNYVVVRIRYNTLVMPMEQAQALQRALVGAVSTETSYSPHLLYGSEQVQCDVQLLNTPILIVPVGEQVKLAEYITCREAAYKIDTTVAFPVYAEWKKGVI